MQWHGLSPILLWDWHTLRAMDVKRKIATTPQFSLSFVIIISVLAVSDTSQILIYTPVLDIVESTLDQGNQASRN